jgi:probable F420-dependent oxidoreductase
MRTRIGRVGIWTPSSQWSASPELADAAAELEELGYGALWLGSAAGDLELPRALLAATERLVVATAIINVWTDPAGDVARAYARLEADDPDRLMVGLGSSHAPLVERAGIPYEQPLRRLAGYLDELDASVPTIPPERRILAALGPRALELAGRRSVGAHPYLVTPEHTRQARATLGPTPLLVVEQKIVLESDPDRARAIARARIAPYMTLPNYTRSLLRLGFSPQDLDRAGSDAVVDALVAWGEIDAVLERIAEHHAAGADHVAIQILTATAPTPTDPLPRDQWHQLAQADRYSEVPAR